MLCAHTDKHPGSSNLTGMTAVDDNYTGHVDPGTAARRTLPGVTIVKASVGPMDNNAYLVTCSATGQTLLIDAANDADVLIDLVRKHAPKVSLIKQTVTVPDFWTPDLTTSSVIIAQRIEPLNAPLSQNEQS